MKTINKTITLLLLIFTIGTQILQAQAPQMMNYQGVARDGSGNVLPNQLIRLRFKIRDNTSNGTVVYSEVRKVTTNASGLFNVQIAAPGVIPTVGTFTGIQWHNATKFLQVEMDPTGGNTYVNMGTQQIISVPYALHSNTAAGLSPGVQLTPSQIAPGGAVANQVLTFNGTNWAPANVSGGGGLTLPYADQGNADSALFSVTNTSTDASAQAIKGEVNYGIALFGHSENNQGVYGSTSSGTYPAVFGYTYDQTGIGVGGKSYNGTGVLGESFGVGTGVKGTSAGVSASAIGVVGESNSAAGTGVKGTSTNGNGVKGYSNGSSSTAVGVWGESNQSAGIGVLGSSTNGIGIKGTSSGTVAAAAIGVLGQSNQSAGTGVQGSSTSGTGVLGSSTSGIGVKGTTNNTTLTQAAVLGENTGGAGANGVQGIANNSGARGVKGTSANGVGVYGASTDGTGLFGASTNGYALDLSGKVRILGGNTNPGAGKVLTSDAIGNATWESPGGAVDKVAFRSNGVYDIHLSIPHDTWKKLEWDGETYDVSNNFTPYAGTGNTTSGTFAVPYNGLYHFTASVELDFNLVFNVTFQSIRIAMKRGANTWTLAETIHRPYSTTPDMMNVSCDHMLLAGDIIYVEFKHQNTSLTASSIKEVAERTFFTGHLVFKD